MADCDCSIEIKDKAQGRTLIYLLVINGVMFVAEIIAGITGDSTALIADSLDMLANASVYVIGFYAVGKSLAIVSANGASTAQPIYYLPTRNN